MGDLWSRLSESQKKLFGWLALATIIGVGMLLLQPAAKPHVPSPTSNQVQVETPDLSSLGDSWERELTTMLNAMLGGKRSQVFLTLERGPKINIAYNITEEERHSAEELVDWRHTSTAVILRNDGERKETPLVLEQIEPTVRGVLVVIDHEPQAHLRLQIAQAVATVLQVPMYRIEVLFKQ